MDIVNGLRAAAGAPTLRLDCMNCHSRMMEAADTIERLNVAIRYMAHHKGVYLETHRSVVDAALTAGRE
jgi:hypothetical protein